MKNSRIDVNMVNDSLVLEISVNDDITSSISDKMLGKLLNGLSASPMKTMCLASAAENPNVAYLVPMNTHEVLSALKSALVSGAKSDSDRNHYSSVIDGLISYMDNPPVECAPSPDAAEKNGPIEDYVENNSDKPVEKAPMPRPMPRKESPSAQKKASS